jgi:hypothetical protein
MRISSAVPGRPHIICYKNHITGLHEAALEKTYRGQPSRQSVHPPKTPQVLTKESAIILGGSPLSKHERLLSL